MIVFINLFISLILCFLYIVFASFVLLVAQRFLDSRVEHKEGPFFYGIQGSFQIFYDFIREYKKRSSRGIFSFEFFVISFWVITPLLFFFVIVNRAMPTIIEDLGVFILVLLIALSIIFDVLFSLLTTEANESYLWKRRAVVRIFGLGVFSISFLPIIMATGSLDIAAFSLIQTKAPFLNLLLSPGNFVGGIIAFGSVIILNPDILLGKNKQLSINNRRQALIEFIDASWIVVLLSYWIVVYFGGVNSYVSAGLFSFKLSFILFIFLLFKKGISKIKAQDAAEVSLRYLFSFGFIGVLLEVFWIAFVR
ncbi:MAG: NADH-quinone oxidoreductase subunit H [Oligoflexia bacterium]|nr:NADH-quinone oxidoreductase subunit H [Oligoflexia bacterium]